MDLEGAAADLAPLLLPYRLPVLYFHNDGLPPFICPEEDDVWGLCWDEPDGTTHVWVHPDSPPETLLHELCHAAVGPEHMHDWVFQELWERALLRSDRL